jgi:hypothetical protein
MRLNAVYMHPFDSNGKNKVMNSNEEFKNILIFF